MPRSIPATASTPPPLWPWRLAAALSLLPLIAAIGFLVFPIASTSQWGFPVPTTATHHSYLLLLTARELFVTLLAVVLWWCGEVRAMGWLLLLVGVLPAADGWVALQSGATWLQIVQHWAAIPVCAAVGYILVTARR